MRGYTAPSLHTTYLKIREKAPNARIVVLLYPHLFTDWASNESPKVAYNEQWNPYPTRCNLGSASGGLASLNISAEAMIALNKAVDDANTAIRAEVAVARQAGGGDIRIADPSQLWATGTGGRGLCSSSPWINNVSLTNDGWGAGPRPESFHPNLAGQLNFAKAVSAAIQE